ncbi:uncharacterized protein I206_101441 [Kwoniella pini CBS 10737]|uniref:Uncharacterized protein n=1 Tax=Kwoniella pini CBS 10737 TaxID=1296096 RepID=A0A1B9HWN4_9TREE|nr:uncharacterized protein I206_06588 [Kwoniella pini CBS 10737]OCF47682.1 hypothetical protein I206_06588 [Kwoniella pini CBS 10737]
MSSNSTSSSESRLLSSVEILKRKRLNGGTGRDLEDERHSKSRSPTFSPESKTKNRNNLDNMSESALSNEHRVVNSELKVVKEEVNDSKQEEITRKQDYRIARSKLKRKEYESEMLEERLNRIKAEKANIQLEKRVENLENQMKVKENRITKVTQDHANLLKEKTTFEEQNAKRIATLENDHKKKLDLIKVDHATQIAQKDKIIQDRDKTINNLQKTKSSFENANHSYKEALVACESTIRVALKIKSP